MCPCSMCEPTRLAKESVEHVSGCVVYVCVMAGMADAATEELFLLNTALHPSSLFSSPAPNYTNY